MIIAELSPEQAQPRQQDFQIIDVRRRDEYVGELGHIKGAQLATLGPELEQFLQSADRAKPILFVCRSGGRSAAATELSLQMGFKEPYNMSGGMLRWNELGYAVE